MVYITLSSLFLVDKYPMGMVYSLETMGRAIGWKLGELDTRLTATEENIETIGKELITSADNFRVIAKTIWPGVEEPREGSFL